MHKTIAILFISIYLFSATELSQLFKLPVLIEHYKEHQQENPSISFFAFLKMHYANDNKVDADYDKDMKLPFKTAFDASSTVVTNIPPAIFTVKQVAIEYAVIKRKYSLHSSLLLPLFSHTIWQPPKSC